MDRWAAPGHHVAATGATSLVLAVLAGAMATGGYAAAVGLPNLGAVAADEDSVPLPRLALVPDPGPDWPAVVAALLDGLDMVVVATAGDVAAGVARSLIARARSRDAILLPTRAWPGCDLVLNAGGHRFTGLGVGQGRILGHEMTVTATGRGAATRWGEVTVPVPLPSMAPSSPPDRRLHLTYLVDDVDQVASA